MGLVIEFVSEHEIDECAEQELANLLDRCFPGTFEARTYFKQLPHRRLIAEKGGAIVGQMGIDHRIIRVGEKILEIAGAIDLCVSPEVQNRGIASHLLEAFERRFQNADFFVLMADDQRLYRRRGYETLMVAKTKWLAIEERSSFGVIEKDLSDCFMFKPAKTTSWPSRTIDMLGYLF